MEEVPVEEVPGGCSRGGGFVKEVHLEQVPWGSPWRKSRGRGPVKEVPVEEVK